MTPKTLNRGAALRAITFAVVVFASACVAHAQANAFKGEVYRSQDGRVVITITSSDELELSQNGVNLICKYTRQATAIRVIETTMGTSQAVYYRTIPEGLQGTDGRILYSPAALRKVNEQAALASKRAAEQARSLAEERAKEQQRIAEKLQESRTPKNVIFSSEEAGILNIFPSQIFFVTKTTISDVSVTFTGAERIRDARHPGSDDAKRITDPFELSYWFGEFRGEPSLKTTYRYNLPNGPLFQIDVPSRQPGQTSMHGEIDFYFQNSALLASFTEAVTKARQSWLAKYK